MIRWLYRKLDSITYRWFMNDLRRGLPSRSCPDCPHPTDDPANLPRPGE